MSTSSSAPPRGVEARIEGQSWQDLVEFDKTGQYRLNIARNRRGIGRIRPTCGRVRTKLSDVGRSRSHLDESGRTCPKACGVANSGRIRPEPGHVWLTVDCASNLAESGNAFGPISALNGPDSAEFGRFRPELTQFAQRPKNLRGTFSRTRTEQCRRRDRHHAETFPSAVRTLEGSADGTWLLGGRKHNPALAEVGKHDRNQQTHGQE